MIISQKYIIFASKLTKQKLYQSMKPTNKMTFKPIGGVWKNISGDSEVLATTLERLNIIVDDKCQFARFMDYENNQCIEYRAYTDAKITITIWQIM